MGLPELIANSPVPGSTRALTTLQSAIPSTTATTIATAAAAPALLQGTGQFHIIVDSEIMLVTGGSSTTGWTVVRGQEGSTAATHAAGAQVFHDLTREALLNVIKGVAVTSHVKPLGSTVTGNLTLNLGEARVFKGTTTGAVAVQAPTGLPGAIADTLYWELELTGEHPITFPGLTGWRFGGEPPQQAGVNRYTFFTDDGISIYGVGSEGLPSSVLQITSPAEETLAAFIGGKWLAIAISSVGVGKAAVEAIANAASSSAVSSGATPGSIRVGIGTDETAWESLAIAVRETTTETMLVSEPITSSQPVGGPILAAKLENGSNVATLLSSENALIPKGSIVSGSGIFSGTTVVETIGQSVLLSHVATKTEPSSLLAFQWPSAVYSVTVPGITVTLGAQGSGSLVAIGNASGGTIKLKGRFFAFSSTTVVLGETTAVVASSASIIAGSYVTGVPGIPAGTTVASITDATHIVLSKAATASGTANGRYEPPEVSGESTIDVKGEELIGYISNASSVWRPLFGYRSLTALEAVIASVTAPGAFTPLNLNGPTQVVEVTAPLGGTTWPQGIRLERGGVVRLRGIIEAKEVVKTTNTLFTIPAAPSGLRPTTETWVRAMTLGGNSVILRVATNGVVKSVKELLAGEQVILDGCTFTVA